MPSSDLRLHVETDSAAVAARLAALPRDLVRGVFQRPEWIAAWLAAHAATPLRLALVTVTRVGDGAVRLVLPLMLERRHGTACWTALDDGVSDYNAPLFAPDFAPSAAVAARLWARIVEALPVGDLLLLEKMPAVVEGHRNPLIDLDGRLASRFRRHPLPLGGDLEAVRRRFHGHAALARKRRKLGRRGRVDFEVLAGAEALPVLERLMRWRDRRYDGRATTDALYRRLLLDGQLGRVGVLRLDGAPIAGTFGIVDGDALRLLVLAFDEAFAAWSPGRLVIDDMIAWAVEARFGEFDFTIGSEAYKFDFGVESEPLWEIRAPLRWRGAMRLHLMDARRTAAGLVRRALPALARGD